MMEELLFYDWPKPKLKNNIIIYNIIILVTNKTTNTSLSANWLSLVNSWKDLLKLKIQAQTYLENHDHGLSQLVFDVKLTFP